MDYLEDFQKKIERLETNLHRVKENLGDEWEDFRKTAENAQRQFESEKLTACLVDLASLVRQYEPVLGDLLKDDVPLRRRGTVRVRGVPPARENVPDWTFELKLLEQRQLLPSEKRKLQRRLTSFFERFQQETKPPEGTRNA